mmetsp:Transcript_20477/g.49572  ORF Transcript_20477/g.49572 Transcript_20477/m.49572 type:complete len:320 (-) Transcript_20477:395-1354(-)
MVAPPPCAKARCLPASRGPTSDASKIFITEFWRLKAVTTLTAWTASDSTSPARSSSFVDALFCCETFLNSKIDPRIRKGKTAVRTSASRHEAEYAMAIAAVSAPMPSSTEPSESPVASLTSEASVARRVVRRPMEFFCSSKKHMGMRRVASNAFRRSLRVSVSPARVKTAMRPQTVTRTHPARTKKYPTWLLAPSRRLLSSGMKYVVMMPAYTSEKIGWIVPPPSAPMHPMVRSSHSSFCSAQIRDIGTGGSSFASSSRSSSELRCDSLSEILGGSAAFSAGLSDAAEATRSIVCAEASSSICAFCSACARSCTWRMAL